MDRRSLLSLWISVRCAVLSIHMHMHMTTRACCIGADDDGEKGGGGRRGTGGKDMHKRPSYSPPQCALCAVEREAASAWDGRGRRRHRRSAAAVTAACDCDCGIGTRPPLTPQRRPADVSKKCSGCEVINVVRFFLLLCKEKGSYIIILDACYWIASQL